MDWCKIKKELDCKVVFVLILMAVLIVMYLLAICGNICWVDRKIAQFGKVLAGYSEIIYEVDTQEQGLEAVPIMGEGDIEQAIFLDGDMLESEKLLLGFRMATYGRMNSGTLYVELRQGEYIEEFETDIENIDDNEEMYLLFSTQAFEEGEISVKLYSPESSGENCVAVYTINNCEMYPQLCIDGQQTDKNAVIQVYVPSDFAKSDFRKEQNFK